MSSSSSAMMYKSDVNSPKPGKYYRFIDELQKTEIYTLIQHLTRVKLTGYSRKSKADLMLQLLLINGDLRVNPNETKVYLEVEEVEVNSVKRKKLRAKLTVEDESLYAEHRQSVSPKLDMTALIAKAVAEEQKQEEGVDLSEETEDTEETGLKEENAEKTEEDNERKLDVSSESSDKQLQIEPTNADLVNLC